MKRSEMIDIIAQSLFKITHVQYNTEEEAAEAILTDIEEAGMQPPENAYEGDKLTWEDEE